MKKTNYKGRCEKRRVAKCKDIARTYSKLPAVMALAMDMNASFHLVVKEKLPHATIVYDRYHMQAQFDHSCMISIYSPYQRV